MINLANPGCRKRVEVGGEFCLRHEGGYDRQRFIPIKDKRGEPIRIRFGEFLTVTVAKCYDGTVLVSPDSEQVTQAQVEQWAQTNYPGATIKPHDFGGGVGVGIQPVAV